MHRLLSAFARPALLGAALLFVPGSALAQGQGLTVPGRRAAALPAPGTGGDAVLPAGFKELRWGATVEILQVTRGPMERRPSPSADLELLIEAPQPGEEASEIVHYKLWRDQLQELRIYYQTQLEGEEAIAFLERVKDAYGEYKDHVVRRAPPQGKKPGAVVEESWIWEDPFTVQILIRNPQTREWSMLRRSRVIDELRMATKEKEETQDRSDVIDSMPID